MPKASHALRWDWLVCVMAHPCYSRNQTVVWITAGQLDPAAPPKADAHVLFDHDLRVFQRAPLSTCTGFCTAVHCCCTRMQHIRLVEPESAEHGRL